MKDLTTNQDTIIKFKSGFKKFTLLFNDKDMVEIDKSFSNSLKISTSNNDYILKGKFLKTIDGEVLFTKQESYFKGIIKLEFEAVNQNEVLKILISYIIYNQDSSVAII